MFAAIFPVDFRIESADKIEFVTQERTQSPEDEEPGRPPHHHDPLRALLSQNAHNTGNRPDHFQNMTRVKFSGISCHHPIEYHPISLSHITPRNDDFLSSESEFLGQQGDLQFSSTGSARLALFQHQVSKAGEKQDFHADSCG